ncbi:DUF2524 family protein [Ectobacillus ponti]|uniref:YtzC family protein n=1 Tax=Ectobacillus ponti TaxID=2961894 RepID=A0AA41X2P3_9BACI|nr:DUF2524 family protein [Ectobacillus ponti]MCP8967517.1 YtzC family protein [Ectobacillus ponti]
MTTRQSLEQYINTAEQAIQYAQKQLEEGMRQEHHNQMEYSDAQQQLEQAVIGLENLEHSANEDQRERIERALIQMRHLQHQMIVTLH